MKNLAATMLLAFFAQSGFTQTFEVASVKLGDPNAPGTMISFPNGSGFNATGTTASNCLMVAYNIQSYQLAGGPAWMDSQRYDIVAKMPASDSAAPLRERIAQIRVALQALLADRFQLVVHRETRPMPAYRLVAAKNGFKLKETTDSTRGSMTSGRGKFKAQGISIEDFARYLAGNLNSPVVDMTGIKGIYDITLEWTPDGADAAAAGPSIFTALQEQLGLKLETQKAPVEIVVIDKIEKATEN